MSPASGERMTAQARVLKPGHAVTVCAGDVYARQAKHERHIATMLATIANVTGGPNIVG
jgi:acyl-coenzyme A thioesterase PaaI-like protein